ncbi:hypothetical protein D3C79_1018180 [compost metagenome]
MKICDFGQVLGLGLFATSLDAGLVNFFITVEFRCDHGAGDTGAHCGGDCAGSSQ